MKAIVWLLPLLFILHDMEEIILAISWKNSEAPKKRFIRVRFVPFGTFFNTESFSIAVCEELLLLTLVSAFGYFTGHYELWLGFLAANILHLILIHLIGTALVYRSYVPGAITALLTMIPCCLIFLASISSLETDSVRGRRNRSGCSQYETASSMRGGVYRLCFFIFPMMSR